jgi:hypothetical protein
LSVATKANVAPYRLLRRRRDDHATRQRSLDPVRSGRDGAAEEQQARRNAFTAPMKSSNDPVNPLKKRTDRFSAHAA